MFVVDGVKFCVVNHCFDIMILYHGHAVRFEKFCYARYDTMQVRDMRDHIMRVDDISQLSFRCKLLCERDIEEFGDSVNTARDGDFRDIASGLYPKHLDSSRFIILEQISVVACDFNHTALAGQMRASN